MEIKSVRAYQTSDKQTFTDHLEAINHEAFLEVRGVIQTEVGNNANLTTTSAAKLFLNNSEKLNEIAYKFKRKINGVRSRRNVVPVVAKV